MELIKRSDVFLENYSPGAIERLGIGYEEVKKVNPKIIYAAISAYGYTGPLERRRGFDYTAQARSGLMDITGFPDKPPVVCGPSLVDHGTGLYTAFSILAALRYRDMTGKGQWIDMALYDIAVDLCIEHSIGYITFEKCPRRHGSRGQLFQTDKVGGLSDVFEAIDGYVYIHFYKDQGARALKLIGREELIKDPRYDTPEKRREKQEEIHDMIEEWTKIRTRMEVMFHRCWLRWMEWTNSS